MNDYISKPIDRLKLYRVLSRYVSKNSLKNVGVSEAGPAGGRQAVDIEIQGVDAGESMARMGCSPERFIEILFRFFVDFKPVLSTLKESIEQKNLVEARAANHSLKGSSGNLGMVDLCKAAQFLETTIDQGDSVVLLGCYSMVEEHFLKAEATLNSYTSVLAVRTSEGQAIHQVPDYAEIRKLMKDLDRSLEEFDPAESKFKFSALRKYLGSFSLDSELSVFIENLDNQISIYQFNAAREIIQSFDRSL